MAEGAKNFRNISRGWQIAIAVAVGVSAAFALRYGWLENETQAALCRAGSEASLCGVRAAVGWSIHHQLFGLGGLLVGALAWLPRLRWLALPGVLLSSGGIALYNTTFAAIGLIAALLAALR